MITYLSLMFCFLIGLYAYADDKILLDEVKVIVHGPQDSTIFCASDEGRYGIDGRPKNIPGCITEELVRQDALKMNLPLEPEVVQENLNRTVRSFGLKPGDEIKIFEQVGLDREEGFQEFTKMYAVNSMVDFKIKSNIVITEEQVIKYWQENPIYIEERFCLKTAFLEPVLKKDGTRQTSEEFEQYVDKLVSTSDAKREVAWGDDFWLKKSEVAQQLEPIFVMKKNEILKVTSARGYQLCMLVDHEPQRTVPLNERYREIVEALKAPLFEQKLKAYQQDLLNDATVIYL